MSEKILEIRDLYTQYNTDEGIVHAVNGMSLTLNRGEVLGLVGETGAGKSTLALSLLRILPDKVGEITGGDISFAGIDILKANKKEMLQIRGARISMIFQDPMTSLNPVITVGDQIREVIQLHERDLPKHELEQRVDEMLSLVGIQPERKKEYPFQFSGGMKQRIGIAMALVARPELLIADEPTTALDVTIQAQMLRLMANLKEQFDTSMIFITHDLGVVAEFCDRVAVVYAGQIVEEGRVEDVFSRARNHPYTEGLFNSIPDLTTVTRRLKPIPGFMVDPTNLPAGCKFADRCPYCADTCRQQEPPLAAQGAHSIRCVRNFEKAGE